jgi:hypothetical protein
LGKGEGRASHCVPCPRNETSKIADLGRRAWYNVTRYGHKTPRVTLTTLSGASVTSQIRAMTRVTLTTLSGANVTSRTWGATRVTL